MAMVGSLVFADTSLLVVDSLADFILEFMVRVIFNW